MQRAAVASLLFSLCGASDNSEAASEHPIGKVIDLIDELKGLIKESARDETENYEKFEGWCKDSIKQLSKAIAKGKDDESSLKDEVSSLEEEEATLKDKIQFLADEITKNDVSGQKAKEERDDANKLYEEQDSDYGDTVDAIKDAIKELEDAESDTSLVQIRKSVQQLLRRPLLLSKTSSQQRQALGRVTDDPQMLKDIVAVGNEADHGKTYDFKSGNIIDLLKQLQEKFEDDKKEATKKETAAANAYEKEKGARDEAMDAAKDAKDEKETALGETQSDLTEAKENLQSTQDDLEADETSLTDTETNCKEKAAEWEKRCELRDHEMKAMVKAREILEDVKSVKHEVPDNKPLPSGPVDLQIKHQLSFLQVLDPKTKAINLIRANAVKTHSKILERFADQLAAHLTRGGPFDSIDNDIQKMIFRLMAEQKDEDDHKNWCELEIQKSEDAKENKEERVDTLKTKIEDGKATSEELETEIEDAKEMIDDINKHMKEAKEIRQEGKKENQKVMKDAQSAQAAIAKAEAVLTAFYKESGEIPKEPWEFLQREPQELPEEPSTWDASYTGVKDPNNQENGILAVLQAVSSDFSETEAETRANEMEDQKAFDEDMQANDIEKARRTKEVEMKEQEKQTLDDKVKMMTKLRQKVNTQLEAVKKYLKDLEPACVDGDSTYEDRKKARADEIDALKEARGILKDAFKEDSFLQTQHRKAFLS